MKQPACALVLTVSASRITAIDYSSRRMIALIESNEPGIDSCLIAQEISKSSAYTNDLSLFHGNSLSEKQHTFGQRSLGFEAHLSCRAAEVRDTARTHKTSYTREDAFERLLDRIVVHEISEISATEATKFMTDWTAYITKAKNQFIADCPQVPATAARPAYNPRRDVFVETCNVLTQNILFNRYNLAHCTTKQSKAPENDALWQVAMIQKLIRNLEIILFSKACSSASADAPVLISGVAYVSALNTTPVMITRQQLMEIDPLRGENYLAVTERILRENEQNPMIVSGFAAARVGVNLDGTSDHPRSPEFGANSRSSPDNAPKNDGGAFSGGEPSDEETFDSNFHTTTNNTVGRGAGEDSDENVDDKHDKRASDDIEQDTDDTPQNHENEKPPTDNTGSPIPPLGDHQRCVNFLLILWAALEAEDHEGKPWPLTRIHNRIDEVVGSCGDDVYIAHIATALWIALDLVRANEGMKDPDIFHRPS
jgi:hypothetical protein